MGRMAGADWYMDQNVASHTTGARGGAAIVTTASQVGSSINTSTWTASGTRLKRGDVIQFTGVFAVNPQTHGLHRAPAGFYPDGGRGGGRWRALDAADFPADYCGARPTGDGE